MMAPLMVLLYVGFWAWSIYGLVVLPLGSGGWLLVGVVAGVMSAVAGWAFFCLEMMSDWWGWSWRFIVHWAGIILGGASTVGGVLLAVYCLFELIWHGSGLSVDVQVVQKP